MKAIYTLTLVLIQAHSLAQDNIEGIGPFKIGQTGIEVMSSLSKELRVKQPFKVMSSITDPNSYKLEKGILQIEPNLSDPAMSPLRSNFCSTARVYLVRGYKVAGVELKDLYLTFYQDKLISLYCDRTRELEEALKAKFGTPEQVTHSDTLTCINSSSGKETKLVQQDIREYWRNGSITAALVYNDNFNNNCKAMALTYFIVGLPSAEDEIELCSDKEAEARKVERRKELKAF